MVKVKNITKGGVVYLLPDRHVKRSWEPRNIKQVPFDELEEALFVEGIAVMFKEGLLKVMDDQDAIDLGLLGGDAPMITQNVAEEDEVLKMLKGSPVEFYKFLKNAAPATKELVVRTAIDHEITDATITGYIRKCCGGVDILRAVLNARDAKAPVEDIED
jgi:hypothetical protein